MTQPRLENPEGADPAAATDPGTPASRDGARKARLPVGAWGGLGTAVESSDASGNLVLIVDARGAVLDVLDSPPDDDSLYPGDLHGSSIDSLWPTELVGPLRENLKRALRSRQVRCLQLKHAEQNSYYEFIFVAQGRDRALLIVRDISAVQREISRLERLAYTDEPTGLPNREWFLAEIDRIAQRLRLKSGRAAVICVDICQLERAGGTAPRARRESMLRELAARLLSSLRGANRPGSDDDARFSLVARVDSQRFGVILPHIETGEDAAAVAARLTALLERPIHVGTAEERVKAVAGIALYPQDGDKGFELYDNATTAVEDAKNSLSSQQRFHSGTVQMRALERQDLELELKSALERSEFELAYQPIIEPATGAVKVAEALLRWSRPLSGSMSAREVVAAADYTGLILPIGEWVFATACSQLGKWHTEGHTDLRIAINVSPQEFARAQLVERTQRILDASDLEPRFVTLEITEHLLFRDAMNDFAICRGLKSLGVSIFVDDYGTGICSFENLSRGPVDAVKIHEKFVAEIADNATSRTACAAVIAMAHELGFEVVAEGIETQAQAAALGEMGCDYLQGYLFSMPKTPDELTAYLSSAAHEGATGRGSEA